jgi:hypothetical protein
MWNANNRTQKHKLRGSLRKTTSVTIHLPNFKLSTTRVQLCCGYISYISHIWTCLSCSAICVVVVQFYYAFHIACFLEFSEMWTNMEPPNRLSGSGTDYWRGYYWMRTSSNRAPQHNRNILYRVYKPTEFYIRERDSIIFHINGYEMTQYNTLTPKNIVTVCYKPVWGNISRAVVNQMILHYNKEFLLTDFYWRDVFVVQLDC